MRSVLSSGLVLAIITALLPTLAFADGRVGVEVVVPSPVVVVPGPVLAPGPVVVVEHRHHGYHRHHRREALHDDRR